MTQNELWITKYNEYRTFVEKNHRCPSKHYIEEHNLHTWWKHNRRMMNSGAMSAGRMEKFKELIALAESNRHLNQYK